MNDGRPHLSPVSPRLEGRGLWIPPRTAVGAVIVAVFAFGIGFAIAPTRESSPEPSPVPPNAVATATVSPAPVVTASPAPSGFPIVTVPPMTVSDAREFGQLARFYAAYNAGQLGTVMAILSAQPRLIDCDYTTHRLVTLVGRTAIAAYLEARFAEGDRWTVAFLPGHPEDRLVIVVLPLTRRNATLRRLGDPGGVKRTFPVVLALTFNPDLVHLDVIYWGTTTGGPLTVTELCSP